MAEEYIQGWRPKGGRPKSQMPKLEYLQQTKEAANLRRELWDVANREEAPCVGRPDEFSGDDLPSDREAKLMCATCPLAARKVCSEYAKVAHPAWGVFSGEVFGRKLEAAMKEEE